MAEPTSGDMVTEQETGTPTLLSPAVVAGVRYQDAAVWVLITAFIGMAIGWETGWFAPWIGSLTGGGAAYLVGGLVLAYLDSSESRRTAPTAGDGKTQTQSD